MPSHGHVNPTLRLVDELTRRGEQVFYFASDYFRTKNVAYQPAGAWQFAVSGGYNSPHIYLQGGSDSYFFSLVSVNKSFLNKQLTVVAWVNNPYQRTSSFKTCTTAPDLYQQTVTTKNYFRSYVGSLTYKFGRLNKDMKRNRHSIYNDDKVSDPNK